MSSNYTVLDGCQQEKDKTYSTIWDGRKVLLVCEERFYPFSPFSKCLIFTGMSKVLSLFSGAEAQLQAVANSPLSLAQGSVMWTHGCFHTGPPCTGVVSLVPNHLWATKHLLIPPKALWLTETNSPLKIELMQCDDSETSRDFFICLFWTTNGSAWGLPRVKLQTTEPNFDCADLWSLAHYRKASP